MKVAVAGAGIYGSTVALRLAEYGHQVHLFDGLGIMRAASAINQYRVHSGYHYPRSPETIRELLETRAGFLREFAPAIVENSQHFYAIPKQNSRTPPDLYEQIIAQHGLPLERCRPQWLDFGYIDACYKVDEHIYDPDILRRLIETRINSLGVRFRQQPFGPEMKQDYDFVVWATYGMGASRTLFHSSKYQVAEKVLIQLPKILHHQAVVVVDGPFTAFDPYGSSTLSLFGSAKHSNHWSSTNPEEPVPDLYARILNAPEFQPVAFTRFAEMRADCCLAIPAAKDATYLGSRFTMRVVENNPHQDRRTLYVREGAPRELHIFSGKVVSAVKAARVVCEKLASYG